MQDFTKEEYEQLRIDFEKVFGPMPSSCTWTGSSFCATSFNAWDAHRYDEQFKGFCAGRAPANFNGNVKNLKITDDPIALKKQARAMVSLIGALESQLSTLNETAGKARAAIVSLESEREMNSILTKEVELLELKLEQARKANPST